MCLVEIKPQELYPGMFDKPQMFYPWNLNNYGIPSSCPVRSIHPNIFLLGSNSPGSATDRGGGWDFFYKLEQKNE